MVSHAGCVVGVVRYLFATVRRGNTRFKVKMKGEVHR